MSKRKIHIEEEVRKTMEMADHIQKVEGNPFLLTRVIQQLENEKKGGIFSQMAPAYKMAFSVVIIALNAFVILQLSDFKFDSGTESAAIDFADEYGLVISESDELSYVLEK